MRRVASTQQGEMTKPRMEATDLNDDVDDHGIVVKEQNGASSTVTVENIKTLQCGVCQRPLKPPIFQCLKGRVTLCSHCCDLPLLIDDDDRRCLACRVSGGGHYLSCPAMDRLVASVRVPCPHAAHGCAARMPFYDQRGHGEACRYAPRGCPVKACAFAGPVWALLEHLSGEHLGVEAVQRFWAEDLGDAMAKLKVSVEADEMSEAGMKPSDIELVMAQASVPRSAAVRALKEKDGDFVNAFMALVNGDVPI